MRPAHRRHRLRHHGPARPDRAAVPRRDPLRLHPPRLSPRRRGAFRGGLCARARHAVDDFAQAHPRHRRADPRPAGQRHLDGAAADAALRGDRDLRHGDAAGAAARCRRRWWWSRAWRARSIRPSTCGRRRSRWSPTGSSAISVPPGSWKWPRKASAPSAGLPANCRALPSAPSACRPSSTEMGERGIRLDPETIDGHRPLRGARGPLGADRADASSPRSRWSWGCGWCSDARVDGDDLAHDASPMSRAFVKETDGDDAASAARPAGLGAPELRHAGGPRAHRRRTGAAAGGARRAPATTARAARRIEPRSPLLARAPRHRRGDSAAGRRARRCTSARR